MVMKWDNLNTYYNEVSASTMGLLGSVVAGDHVKYYYRKFT